MHDEDFTAAAARELAEETGVRLGSIESAGLTPLHIDVHPIPANDVKGEPEHRHFDFRMLFRTAGECLLSLQQEEVLGAGWRPVTQIADPELRARVGELVGVTGEPGAHPAERASAVG